MNQVYDQNVAIDFEWTPVFNADKPKGLAGEVIEVGAVKLGPDGEELDSFSEFVKPAFASGISRRVRKLTGIRDTDLAGARGFEAVMRSLEAWIGCERTRMVTWGCVDRMQIRSECAAKDLSLELPARWLDLQKLYPRLMGTHRRRVGLGEAADWCGLAFETRHRAVCDARATGQIFHMAATGECAEQRELLQMRLASSSSASTCTSSIAERCGQNLGALFAKLKLEGL